MIINIGDMLDILTEGRYRSTPHRVLNVSGRDRLSFPFFLDPSLEAEVIPLPLSGSLPAEEGCRRWDKKNIRAWNGKYGEYLLGMKILAYPHLFKLTD